MEDRLCSLIHFDICSFGFDNDCSKCPLDIPYSTPWDGVEYLKEIKENIEKAIAIMEG